MLTVVCCVKRLDLFCATYSHPPTLTYKCIIFLRFNTSKFRRPFSAVFDWTQSHRTWQTYDCKVEVLWV